MTRRRRLWIIIVPAVVVLAIAYVRMSKEIAIDACLDGGGRWNYATNTCEH